MKINNEEEYEAALREYNNLWDESVDTIDGTRLEELLDAMIEYEGKVNPFRD